MTNLSRRALFRGMASAAFAAVVAKVGAWVPESAMVASLGRGSSMLMDNAGISTELTDVVRDTWVEGGELQFADVTLW